MNKVFAAGAALALLCLGGIAQANVFNLGSGLTNLETVTVGDPGNDPDTRYGTPGYGSVGYAYNIGKYEVTAAQYADFLNNKAATYGDPYGYGLYNKSMAGTYGCKIQRSGDGTPADPYVYTVADDWANRPVNYISFWDACRFANWLHNGQGNGDTETGAYTLNGYSSEDDRTIYRNANWKWAVTSEDEWYKAAYYKGGGTNASYWVFPTQSNTPPTHKAPTSGANSANYMHVVGQTTNVGAYTGSASAYGTFDQAGNVWEWNEAIVYDGSDHAYRGQRGGSYYNLGYTLPASNRYYTAPTLESSLLGFRVSYVPEPSPIIALAGGLISLLGMRRRRA